jgi:hypothetical protein
MSRIHLRDEIGIERFLDGLVEAAAGAGADRVKARAALRAALSRDLQMADLCGIFANCGVVSHFEPFTRPDDA